MIRISIENNKKLLENFLLVYSLIKCYYNIVMGAKKHIKMAMEDKEIKPGKVAELIEMPAQSFYNKINRDSMSFLDVEKIANVLNCDVVLVDRETGRRY